MTAVQRVKDHPVSSGSLTLAAVVVAAISLTGVDLSEQQYNSVVILCGAAPILIQGVPKAIIWVKGLGAAA